MRRLSFQAIPAQQRKEKLKIGKILDAFADNELCAAPMAYKGSAKYRKAVDAMFKTAEALETALGREEKELFEQFCAAQQEESHLYQLDSFSRGFRIAVLMLFEVFAAGKDEFILSKEAKE